MAEGVASNAPSPEIKHEGGDVNSGRANEVKSSPVKKEKKMGSGNVR